MNTLHHFKSYKILSSQTIEELEEEEEVNNKLELNYELSGDLKLDSLNRLIMGTGGAGCRFFWDDSSVKIMKALEALFIVFGNLLDKNLNKRRKVLENPQMIYDYIHFKI